MPAIAYPVDLPPPRTWSGSDPERRAVSSLPGNTALRNRTRDSITDIEASWFYDSVMTETWMEWYEFDLLFGQAWFTMSAPGVGGWQDRVLRYRTRSVKRELIGNGAYIISAQLQMRGANAGLAWRY